MSVASNPFVKQWRDTIEHQYIVSMLAGTNQAGPRDVLLDVGYTDSDLSNLMLYQSSQASLTAAQIERGAKAILGNNASLSHASDCACGLHDAAPSLPQSVSSREDYLPTVETPKKAKPNSNSRIPLPVKRLPMDDCTTFVPSKRR